MRIEIDNMDVDNMDVNNNLLSYEKDMHNLIEYMYNNSIFNTYVTNIDDDNNVLTIILKTRKSTMKNLLNHLGKYNKIKKEDTLVGEKCIICFDNYKPNECVRKLNKCGHIFHKKCIDKWFYKNEYNMNCPICRTNYNKRIIL